MRRLRNVLALSVLLSFVAAGCGVDVNEPDPSEESGALSGGKADRPQACPYLLIQCPVGQHAKQLPGCNQTCVPDHGAECSSDSDCQIYCITTPCPVGQCTGGSCRVKSTKPPKSTSSCQPDCGSGEYCTECRTINGSAFVCLPDGAVC